MDNLNSSAGGTVSTPAPRKVNPAVLARLNGKSPPADICAACRAVPNDTAVRLELERKINEAIRREHLIAPMDWDELMEHRDRLMEEQEIPAHYKDFVAVLLSNAVWLPVLRKIPYERRVLLLPQCLRREDVCQAEIDEFGLLCLECGGCSIGRLQPFAESLGYSVVVAEGTTIVTQMIESGQVEAVVGVSCLSVLERAFPHMAAHAIPGVALPLLREGCVGTDVDNDWLIQVLQEYRPDEHYTRIDLNALQKEVADWFTEPTLRPYLVLHDSSTEACALDWMVQGGKRWRPLLTLATYRALTGSTSTPAALKTVAIAVECFHKASLIHDDLADDQEERYGLPSLHEQVGRNVALNAGDLLIGEGYRLLAESGFAPDVSAKLLGIAARGHRDLSLGQGEELWAEQYRTPLTHEKIIEIFGRKTSPAFCVALSVGAVCAYADNPTLEALQQFSDALGVGYQIQDDLEDADEDKAEVAADAARESNHRREPGVAAEWTPSILSVLQRRLEAEGHASPERAARGEATSLLEHYRSEAMGSLRGLRNGDLKALLHRLCSRILKRNKK